MNILKRSSESFLKKYRKLSVFSSFFGGRKNPHPSKKKKTFIYRHQNSILFSSVQEIILTSPSFLDELEKELEQKKDECECFIRLIKKQIFDK